MRNGTRSGLLWASIPLLLYIVVLQRLWFNAPIWDDYDAILDSAMHMIDSSSAAQWLGYLVVQHNEHRIAVMRFVAWSMAVESGQIDFRALVFIGNLTLFGIFFLAWLEFRDAVAAPLFAAAGFIMFQWSYYEASLMGSAALPNIGVVFFSMACLFFAIRAGAAGAALCVAFGILSVGSQANGLLALPLAAFACALDRRFARAGAFAAVALVLWALYFWSYHATPGHPSLMEAFRHPLVATQVFLVDVGGIVPGLWAPTIASVPIVAAIAWLAHKRIWKSQPAAALWIVFLLASVGAATMGRAGFGVFHASRYAVYSTSLVVVAFLAIAALTRPWTRAMVGSAIVVSIAACFIVSWMNWPKALEYSLVGQQLAKIVPADTGALGEAYPGMFYPSHERGTRILREAERHGLYSPTQMASDPASVRTTSDFPVDPRRAGYVDEVRVSGSLVSLIGWSDIPAGVPGRTLVVLPSEGITLARYVATIPRPDVVHVSGDARLLSSGFRVDVGYASPEEARRFAASLCVAAEAPGHSIAVLGRETASCAPASLR